MTVIVTGAGGFVGREIVARLLARGDAVVALDARAEGIPDGAKVIAGHSCPPQRPVERRQSNL